MNDVITANLPILAYELPSCGGRIERQTYEGQDWWIVRIDGMRLSKSGSLDFEPLSSSKTDEWISVHRFESVGDAYKTYLIFREA